jgi:hypothetical protein
VKEMKLSEFKIIRRKYEKVLRSKEREYEKFCNSMKEDCSNCKYKDVSCYDAFMEDNDCDIE